ncbi:uncharacterized protein QC761_0002600 [Podospora bellae-mahoneyi]|uniref:Uncharacterized protein n=1 Tax=Podospora bellae-mahoneyi TaxID=2093777 RepID=A0ABR0FUI4_9PEZI|nr:hypothetical protein QC761_0002600 [Podospora bellae-mahoneyi]
MLKTFASIVPNPPNTAFFENSFSFGYACRAGTYSIQLLDWPEELGDCTIQELFLFYPQDDDPVFCPQDPNNDEAGVS